MYQALYRKYRPTNFDDVIGQEVIVKTLKNAILNDKISHAYLFTGPKGTGKTSIAKILAKTINCGKLNGYLPCYKCEICMQNDQKGSDVIEIDAASNNGVDEIREIISKVNLVPSLGKYKVYIIDEVHMLTTGAFNALLKTLEDPPSHVIFIFATTEPHKILSTILSRCQRFDFKKLSISKIQGHITKIAKSEGIKLDDSAILEISRLSEGSLRDAIGLLDQANAYTSEKITSEDIHEINGTLPSQLLNNFILTLFQKNIIESLTLLREYVDSGRNVLKIIEEIMTLLKDLLIYDLDSSSDLVFIHDKESLAKIFKMVDKKEALNLLDVLIENYNKIKMSRNPELLFELILIKQIGEETVENLPSIKEKKQQNSEDGKEERSNKKENNKKDINVPSKETENTILEELQEIRIGNTLSKFLKSEISNVKKKISKLEKSLLDEEKSLFASVVLDGEIKAASGENLIFVYETEKSASFFNKNILNIEELLREDIDCPYKVIAVSSKNWEIIKDDFNNKKKEYKYTNKDDKIISKLDKQSNEEENINSLFGNIIEYE